MAETFSLVRQITACARCGQDHTDVTFKQLAHPVQIFEDTKRRNAAFFRNPSVQLYTHWAPCPANGEPILMKFYNGPSCCVGGRCQSRAPGHREGYKAGQPVSQEQLDAIEKAQAEPTQ